MRAVPSVPIGPSRSAATHLAHRQRHGAHAPFRWAATRRSCPEERAATRLDRSPALISCDPELTVSYNEVMAAIRMGRARQIIACVAAAVMPAMS